MMEAGGRKRARDWRENLHVLSRFVQLKSVLLISCVTEILYVFFAASSTNSSSDFYSLVSFFFFLPKKYSSSHVSLLQDPSIKTVEFAFLPGLTPLSSSYSDTRNGSMRLQHWLLKENGVAPSPSRISVVTRSCTRPPDIGGCRLASEQRAGDPLRSGRESYEK